jgi:DNA-binding NarL/FixJ family response regulator
MDLRMPGTDRVTATAEITARSPATRVLVLTTYDADADIPRATAAGVIGYLLKDTPRAELFSAIHAAADGRSTLTPSVATKLVRQQHGPPQEPLSPRELQVLCGLARVRVARHRLPEIGQTCRWLRDAELLLYQLGTVVPGAGVVEGRTRS